MRQSRTSACTRAEAVRNFRPLRDMILVLPDNAPDMVGLIVIPQGALPQGQQPGDYRDTFMGTVVAVGPGDKHTPAASLKCRVCGEKRTYRAIDDMLVCACAPEDPLEEHRTRPFHEGPIRAEDAARWDRARYPMYTKVGDRVAFPRRPSSPNGIDPESGNCDLYIDGVGYLLFHEEQSAYAIIEEE